MFFFFAQWWKSTNENACMKASLLEYRIGWKTLSRCFCCFNSFISMISLKRGYGNSTSWHNAYIIRYHLSCYCCCCYASIHIHVIKSYTSCTHLVLQFWRSRTHFKAYTVNLWTNQKDSYTSFDMCLLYCDIHLYLWHTPIHAHIVESIPSNHEITHVQLCLKSQIIQYRAEVKCIK